MHFKIIINAKNHDEQKMTFETKAGSRLMSLPCALDSGIGQWSDAYL